MKTKKPTALFLSVIILTAVILFSCAEKISQDNQTNPKDGPGGSGADAEAAEEKKDKRDIDDNLPEMDFNGTEFNILSREERDYEFFSEGETGEIINDSVFRRNRKIEERFNVKINVVKRMGDWANQNIFMNTFKSSVLAGDAAFDLVAGYQAYFMGVTTEGLLYDVNSFDYINPDKPWWAKSVFDELTFNGKLYIMAGDLSLTMWEYMYGVYFNKTMAKDYGFPDLYQIARDGKWTVDALQSFIKDIYEDLDGDGKMTKADKFGYATETGNLVDLFMAAFDIPITEKGPDGLPALVLDSRVNLEKMQRAYDFVVGNPSVYAQPESVSTPDNPLDVLFHENRAMFLPDTLGNSKKLRSVETDFGILPLPKYDESQSKYHVYPQNGFSVLGVPSDVQNTEKAAVIIEALCAESYKLVIPAFYDVALKNKFTRDDESGEMIDLIRDGVIFNFGMLYTNIINHPGVLLRNVVTAKKDTFVSTLEKEMPKWEVNIEKIIEKIS